MKKKKLIIGLTGGIGSGKSTVCQMFCDLGITVIDADQIAREIVMPGSRALKKIVEKFGDAVLQEGNALNREALRKLVFEDPSAKAWLESLLHPIIYNTMIDRAQKADSPYVILDIPLLVETIKNKSYPIREYLDRILVIDTTEALQISRIKNRDQCKEEDVRKIITQQASRKERLTMANDIIENNTGVSELRAGICCLHNKYLNEG